MALHRCRSGLCASALAIAAALPVNAAPAVDAVPAIDALLDDEEFDIELEQEVAVVPKPNPSVIGQITANWSQAARFTLSQELGYAWKEPKQMVINRSSVRFQWEQLLAQRYFARLDAKTAYDFVYDRGDYPSAVNDKYRTTSTIREAYVQANFGPLSVKVGKQIVVWGKADAAVVTDIISPRDLTELVFTPVEDARLGQQMITVDYFAGTRQWSLILNPDAKVNRFADPGHPYGPTPGNSLVNLASLADEKPDASLSDPEVGIRWADTRGRWDFSVMAAEVFEDNPLIRLEGLPDTPASFTGIYPRYQMLGGGFNLSRGKFVWKGELAYKQNRRFNRNDSFNASKHKTWDTSFGFDFNDNGAYTLSLEVSNQHLSNWDRGVLRLRRDETLAYLIWNKLYVNDTVTLQYTSSYHLQDDEHFHRFEYRHDLTNQTSLELQADYFKSRETDTLFGQLRDKHRITATLAFDF